MTRKYCRCLLSDGIEALREKLLRVEVCLSKLEARATTLGSSSNKGQAAVKELSVALNELKRTQKAQQATLAELKRQEAAHNGTFRAQYARSMIDLGKKLSINEGKSREPLRTSAWKVGDVKRLREGPKNAKRGRKKRTKKAK